MRVFVNERREETEEMDYKDYEYSLTGNQTVDDVVSIFMTKTDGDRIARLVDNGTKVMMRISVGKPIDNQFTGINKTSILFVSISFIVLMIISLAWLVFYYIQRFRYAHAKERLSKRLMNAAKKAISKMPVRTVRSGDSDCNNEYEQCAVCIDMYKVSDALRILPCKHFFHKTCIDPWLIEHRSCPMCKLDVLKAYGLQVSGVHESYESVLHDLEAASSPSAVLPGEEVPLAIMEEAAIGLDEPEPSSSRIYTGPPELELHQTPQHILTQGGTSLDSVHTVDSDCAERELLMGPAQNTADSADDGTSST